MEPTGAVPRALRAVGSLASAARKTPLPVARGWRSASRKETTTIGGPLRGRRAWRVAGSARRCGPHCEPPAASYMNHLDRFHSAQDSPDAGFDAALRELQAGRKRGHWIWYILPQLAGLGMSGMSQRYAIRDAQEAVAYLQDPVLRDRLLAI